MPIYFIGIPCNELPVEPFADWVVESISGVHQTLEVTVMHSEREAYPAQLHSASRL